MRSMAMNFEPVLAVVAGALLLGCAARPLSDTEGGSGDTSGGATSSGPGAPTSGDATDGPNPTGISGSVSETASASEAGSSSAGSTEAQVETGCPFICVPDMPEDHNDCPGTQQLDPECPAGHKCTVEGSLGNTQCLEIAPDPKGLYEPCKLMGDWLSGLDDCGLGMLCWNTDENGEGICVGLCDGPESGECVCVDPAATPSWCQECAVGVCLPGCDPVLQDCANPSDGCYPANEGFSCFLDASGEAGGVNEPCEFINFCDPGLACIEAQTASEACDPQAGGCCTPFCEFPGGACPNPDQACAPWFPEGNAPAGLEHVGICITPQ